MTMIEEPVTAPAKPAAKRKPAKKRARAAPAPVKARGEMEGITRTDCALACTAAKCAISGVGICAHPFKGGLQANLQNPDTLRRYNAAKRAIGKAKLDLGET
jgi:hypothetical protein